MSLKISTGKKNGAQIHVIAGTNGVGKTTWATSFPDSILLDIENGSNHLDVSRVEHQDLKTLDQVKENIKLIASGNHKFKTLVIDSVEALESLIFDFVCTEGGVNSIEKYDGGFGKGMVRSREIMREIMISLQDLKAQGISSILVAHTQVKPHTDPAQNQTYDRIIMRANDKMAAIVRDLADNVFYASFKVHTAIDGGKTRAFGDGQRVLYKAWRAGFDAKSRIPGIPFELPLSYTAFKEACDSKPDLNAEKLLEEIKQISQGIKSDVKATILNHADKFKTNPEKLQDIKTRAMSYLA